MSPVSLVSSIEFDTDPLLYLCPGTNLQLSCVAINFPSLDWARNGEQLVPYTSLSTAPSEQRPTKHISVVLNDINATSAFSINFNTTLTTTLGDGLSAGDVISCGHSLLNTSEVLINYTTIRKLSMKIK